MGKAMMTGYLESWGNVTFAEAAKQGYTAIILAFGTVNGGRVNLFNGKFAPSPTPEALKQDIREAKENGAAQVLFSVGGGNNTYLPGEVPAGELAASIVEFLEGYGFTGVDFDLEIDTSADYLDRLCAEIKAKNSSLIITAAPQVNQADHASDIFLVSTANCRIYDKAVHNRRFDYLFIQGYNNGWPEIGGCRQEDVCFVSRGFESLIKSIPSETAIAMGEPASIRGAGQTSIFHGPDAGDGIYAQLADQFKEIRDDPQFGGAMVWDVNWDEKNHYRFIRTIKPALEER